MTVHCPTCGRASKAGSSFCRYDGTPLAETSTDPLIGQLIAKRYRISRELGAGGNARVYLAHHAVLGKDVAFKVLRPELATDQVFVARFVREAQMIGRIDHPNVVGVLDFGRDVIDDDPFFYLVMEYVSGRCLDREIQRGGAMPAQRAAHILTQIAAGVARAHELGIVHRDLKPQNVMLRQRGSEMDFVTILDFGLSRTIDADPKAPRVTEQSQAVGTPIYMAPEQWRGESLDVRSDIYALGVIGYELLTGQPPFAGTTIALMFKHVEEAPKPPSELVPEVHLPLESVVLRCMEKAPEKRFATVAELMAALGEAWRTLPRLSHRTTYAATSAAPPRPTTEELPDPTLWQSKAMDALDDGPSVVAEIGRLLALRRRLLAELATSLWPEAPPAEVATVREEIDELEGRIDGLAESVAVLEDELEELDRDIRHQESELRAEIIGANVMLTIPPSMQPEPAAEVDSMADTVKQSPKKKPRSPVERISRAEKNLARLSRRLLKEQLSMRERLNTLVTELRTLESQLGPRYEKLAERLDTLVPRGSELQPQLVAFQRVDGAIAAYEGLLTNLEDLPVDESGS